jgi:excisionase family DNA binding protein
MGKLLTTKELMDLLKISRDTVYRWRNERGLPYKKIGPAAVRYDEAAVREWLEQQADHLE